MHVLAAPLQSPKRKQRLSALADQLSCALFGIANTVTALFFAIEKSTHGLVEGGALQRPAWLNLAVHVANSLVAWLDLLIGGLLPTAAAAAAAVAARFAPRRLETCHAHSSGRRPVGLA
jgi:hypothetical protein